MRETQAETDGIGAIIAICILGLLYFHAIVFSLAFFAVALLDFWLFRLEASSPYSALENSWMNSLLSLVNHLYVNLRFRFSSFYHTRRDCRTPEFHWLLHQWHGLTISYVVIAPH